MNPRGGKKLRSYQSTVILKPDFDEKQVDQALEEITSLIKKSGGSCLKIEKWGKKRLAYRIKKNRFGFYLNIYHTCEASLLSSLENEYKLSSSIIKYLVIRLEKKELERAMARETEKEDESAGPSDKAKEENKAKTIEAGE
ncbi:MAG: 30S ribosomal protein S6 [Nitrospinota bacterium]|nr:30S ribosomal protein S6 [Nitrospinota bacterium]